MENLQSVLAAWLEEEGPAIIFVGVVAVCAICLAILSLT